MKFSATELLGAYVIDLEPSSDERGWFARTWCAKEFAQIGHDKEWVQMNHSYTKQKGTIRGMHFQWPPYAEIKLVRCIAGDVFDVIIDLREDSPSFLKWFGVELSASNRKMLYIPEGFAHGFQTLSDNCEMLYAHSGFYTPDGEGAIKYDDPAIHIDWPLPVSAISPRDNNHPLLTDTFKGIKV